MAHTARCCTLCLIGILVARIRGRRQVGHSARLLDLGATDTLEELLVGRVLAQGLRYLAIAVLLAHVARHRLDHV